MIAIYVQGLLQRTSRGEVEDCIEDEGLRNQDEQVIQHYSKENNRQTMPDTDTNISTSKLGNSHVLTVDMW